MALSTGSNHSAVTNKPTGKKMSLPSSNDADHTNALSWMKPADDDKLKTLNSRTESVMTDMKMVLSNQDRLEELLKANLLLIMGPQYSHAASNSDRGRASDTDTAVANDNHGTTTKKKNNKKKKKKKAKSGFNKAIAADWAAGNLFEIVVGLFSIALLLSVVLGRGHGGVWGSSPSLPRKRTGRFPTSNIDTTFVDSQDTTRSVRQLGDDADDEAIDPALVSKLEPFNSLPAHNVEVKASHQRITQSRSLPPTSIDRDSISYYYPSWNEDVHCDNDTSQRPSNYIEIGYTLFETVEDCCKYWTTNQGLPNERYNTCLLNSARTSRPQATEAGIPTTSPKVSGSPTPPVTSVLSQAKGSHVPSSIPTPIDTSNPPTSTVHHQDPHHLDHPDHGDNDTTNVNGLATKASNEPTYLPTSSSNDCDDHDEPIDDQDDHDNDEISDSHDEDNNHDEYVCVSDQKKCGCPHLNQADYRGSINTTMFGTPCERWDADWIRLDYFEQDYLVFLEDNYCRNPDSSKRAWCYTAGGSERSTDWAYCSVPTCWRATCSAADNTTCGCGSVRQSDYRGTMDTTKCGVQCVEWPVSWFEIRPESGIESDDSNNNNYKGNNFCRNPDADDESTPYAWCNTDDDWGYCDIPMCNPHECMPSCGTPNFENFGCPSFLQAEICCEEEEDTNSCKCNHLKEACRKSLDNGDQDFCDDAEAVCCESKYNLHCKCKMYEQICSEFKSEFACEHAAMICCESEVAYWTEHQCYCDFFTYTTGVLSVGGNLASVTENCLEAAVKISSHLPPDDKEDLEGFYLNTGVEHWFNNDGWLDDEDQCKWFGVSCNDDGFVIKVILRNNNLTGRSSFEWIGFAALTWLDLAENSLSGTAHSGVTLFLQQLVHIDISDNKFSGHADMTFSPSTVYANYSHNNFTSVGFNGFNAAYQSMRVVDLSSNRINQAASTFFVNVPLNLEELNLSDNIIRGALPVPFPSLDNLRRLAIANNDINGPLPDFSRSTPRVRELDLSNQKQTGNGGFTGMIAADISRLDDLLILNLAINNLTSVPSDLGNLGKLKTLNISSNFLDHFIPSELGKLAGVLNSLDLSDNKLKGLIPKEFDQFIETSINLHGNTDIMHPAPLMLCFHEFDLVSDTEMCPPERNALKEFYESAKGQDWTNNTMWMHPYASFCKWHGVRCSETNHTVEVNLTNNALTGTLSNHIGNLTHLRILDLADNDLMSSIPKEIGLLSKLVHLRLPYNRLAGKMPSELKNLSELKLAQFHANRISGEMPLLDWNNQEQSSYVTDCGNPSDFETSLVCKECTMCCNAQGDCFPQEKSMAEEAGFKKHVIFTLAFLTILLGVSGVLALTLLAYDKYQHRHVPIESIHSPELTSKDKKHAMSLIGEGSTYKFSQGKSWLGWTIALATVGVQIWMLFIFVIGAEINLADEASALVYTWKCPRDRVECEFKGDRTPQGWVLFFILMGAHLMKDAINGYKLVVFSAKGRHDCYARMRYFVGGTLLNVVTIFTLVVSFIYNYAIATSNMDLIANSVIIIFITDLDEKFHGILKAIKPNWVKKVSCEEERSDEGTESIRDLRRDINQLRESLLLLQQQVRGGNVTQPQARDWVAYSEVSRRSRSSSGGGSDRSPNPPNFRNKRRQRRGKT